MPADLLAAVRAHAEAAYPGECCGAMVGLPARDPAAVREVVRIVPVPNAAVGSGAEFLIPAEAVRALDRDATRDGLAVIGFYHSHPDGRAHPSHRDTEAAWPWYSYLIVAVSAGAAGEARSWRLADDRSVFLPQTLLSPQEAP